MTLSMKQIFSKFNLFEIGMAIGRGGAKGWGLHPRPAWFILPHPCPVSYDGENFLTPSPPLGALQSPTPTP